MTVTETEQMSFTDVWTWTVCLESFPKDEADEHMHVCQSCHRQTARIDQEVCDYCWQK